jgi:Mor family transcriptional regulator
MRHDRLVPGVSKHESDLEAHIREQFDLGVSITYLRRKYQLSRSELRDMLPKDALEEQPSPENSIGGY